MECSRDNSGFIAGGMGLWREGGSALREVRGVGGGRGSMSSELTILRTFRSPLTWPARPSWRTKNELRRQDLQVSFREIYQGNQ